jgi:hypothetical protein
MKPDWKVFDYVSFPADKGSKEIREGFIFRIRGSQLDIVSVRKKNGATFADFGFHKKYIEKNRFDEVKKVELSKDITSWKLYQVVAWAMVRYYESYGDFMTKYIKQNFNPEAGKTEAEMIEAVVGTVRVNTIARDRKAKRGGS